MAEHANEANGKEVCACLCVCVGGQRDRDREFDSLSVCLNLCV